MVRKTDWLDFAVEVAIPVAILVLMFAPVAAGLVARIIGE